MRSVTVGRSSSRTPFKHWILNAELGRLCGIFADPKARLKVPAVANPLLVVDLCAGDGISGEGVNSSPAIIAKHLGWAHSRNVRVKGVFIERQAGTFGQLQGNIAPQPWLEFINGDAREYIAECKPRQAVFIHSDPNHIADWPINQAMLGRLSATTTMLATLGCNVGGLKRLPFAERAKWYQHVAECVSYMPFYHDAILVALDGDSHQWAYLIRLPVKWSRDTCVSIARAGAVFTTFGLTIASYRNDRSGFNALQDRLFLTDKERTC